MRAPLPLATLALTTLLTSACSLEETIATPHPSDTSGTAGASLVTAAAAATPGASASGDTTTGPGASGAGTSGPAAVGGAGGAGGSAAGGATSGAGSAGTSGGGTGLGSGAAANGSGGPGAVFALCASPGPLNTAGVETAAAQDARSVTTAHIATSLLPAAGGSASDTGVEEMTIKGDVDTAEASATKASLVLQMDTRQGAMAMVMLGNDLYLRQPGTGSDGTYLKVDAGEFAAGQGVDIASLAAPLSQLGRAKDALEGAQCLGREQVGGVTTAHVRASLNVIRLSSTTGAAPVAGGGVTERDIWVDSAGRLQRSIASLGPLKASTTYSAWGAPVSVAAPPSSQITSVMGADGTTTAH